MSVNTYLQPDRADEIAYNAGQGQPNLLNEPLVPTYNRNTIEYQQLKQYLIVVLAKYGLTLAEIPLSTLNDLAFQLASDPTLSALKSTGASASTLESKIEGDLFDPAASSREDLLTLGLQLLRANGKPLTADQQAASVRLGGTAIQPIDLKKYPITESKSQGDPGVDYGTPVGTPVVSPYSGWIEVENRGQSDWGLRVIVHLSNGWQFGVGHLSQTSLQNGRQISPGQMIGLTGGAVGSPTSGITSGPHVEFQWISPGGNAHRIDSHWMDPVPMLDGLAAGTVPGAASAPTDVTNIITSVANSLGVDPAVALATAYVESKFNPNAIGDSGHSVGLFQLHDQGEGYGMSVAQREDPVVNAQVALTQFARVAAANPSVRNNPGLWAALAQRPADQALYAQEVNSVIGQIRSGQLPTADYSAAGQQTQLDDLKNKYPSLFSAYNKYFGTDPNLDWLQAAVAAGIVDPAAAENYVRSQPSHLQGLNMGQYTDLKSLVDSTSQQYLGHNGTDGIIAELYAGGTTTPAEVKDWYLMHSPNQINNDTYKAIYTANQPSMQGIYNTTGFDPRIAQEQYNYYVQQAGQTPYSGTPSVGSTSTYTPTALDIKRYS